MDCCIKVQNNYNSQEFIELISLNDLDQAKAYIKSRDNMTDEHYKDSIISVFTINAFSYNNFYQFINDLYLKVYLNNEPLLSHLTHNKKSKYCYSYYNEKQLEYIISKLSKHPNILLIYRGMLTTCICRKFINLTSIIIQELTKNKFKLQFYYQYIPRFFYIPIINLFIKYDPHFIPNQCLTPQQLTIFQLTHSM